MSEIDFDTVDSEMRKGRAEACRAFLDAVPAADHHSLAYLDARVRFHYRRSEFAQVVTVSRDLLEHHPHYSDYRYVLFDSCAHLGRIEVAREAAAEMAAWYDRPGARLIRAEMLYALGLDEEAMGMIDAGECEDHYATIAQMTLCQAAMRRGGVMGGVNAFARAWTTPAAWSLIYGAPAEGPFPLSDYWCGERALPGRLTLLARGGVGDTLQWMRYLPILAAAGVEVAGMDERVTGIHFKPLADEAQNRWARMCLSGRGAGEAEANLWTEPFALFTSLFPTLGYAQRAGGYLQADPDDICTDLLRDIRAKANGRPIVAMTWSSDESPIFASKSLTLAQVGPVLAMDDIYWVVCQRGLQRQAWLDTAASAVSTVLPATLSFPQTGAILQGLDAVVTNCSAIAHLSGGLGCRTFLLASAAADWRWEAFPSSTPWYPDMQLFRQPTLGDWDGAVRNLQAALMAWIR